VDAIVGRQVIFSSRDQAAHWVNIPNQDIADLDRFLRIAHPIDVPWVNGALLIRKEALDQANIRYRPEFEWEDVAFHFECLVSGLRIIRMKFPGPPDSFYRLHAGVRMGPDLFADAGMRSATRMIRWMCDSLHTASEWTDSRRRVLATSLFQTCILRSIDAQNFQLARELIEASAGGMPFTRTNERRIRLYVRGRQLLGRYPRFRYYWDRFARRFLIPEMFPQGASTYGTVVAQSAEIPSTLDHLPQPTA
jgi:hypothetical protein